MESLFLEPDALLRDMVVNSLEPKAPKQAINAKTLAANFVSISQGCLKHKLHKPLAISFASQLHVRFSRLRGDLASLSNSCLFGAKSCDSIQKKYQICAFFVYINPWRIYLSYNKTRFEACRLWYQVHPIPNVKNFAWRSKIPSFHLGRCRGPQPACGAHQWRPWRLISKSLNQV